MANLSRWRLDEKYLRLLGDQGIRTVEELFGQLPHPLAKILGIPLQELMEIRMNISLNILSCSNMIEYNNNKQLTSVRDGLSWMNLPTFNLDCDKDFFSRSISSGSKNLDLLFGTSGLPVGEIIEVTGCRMSGRTQVGLTMALAVSIQNCKSYFIDTDNAVQASRVLDVTHLLTGEKEPSIVLEHISRLSIIRVFNVWDFLDALTNICQQADGIVIVVDCIDSVLPVGSAIMPSNTEGLHGQIAMLLQAISSRPPYPTILFTSTASENVDVRGVRSVGRQSNASSDELLRGCASIRLQSSVLTVGQPPSELSAAGVGQVRVTHLDVLQRPSRLQHLPKSYIL